MRSSVEPLEGKQGTSGGADDEAKDESSAESESTGSEANGRFVRLEVHVDEAELEPAIEAAWREIAKEVRLPGFRPGKAPRKLLEKQFGTGYARSEALRSALPEFYSRAVVEHDVDVIAPPDLDITEGEESGDVTFSAVVEVRPEITVGGYQGLRVEVPSPEVPDEEIDAQIDRLRGQYAELADVDRPVADGDYVKIDLQGSQDGEPVDGLSADDYLYLVGSGMISAELDEQLTGSKVGDILEFEADHPDPEQGKVQFRVLVKGVQERVLPELTDEWVAEATEFDTVEELREDTRSELAKAREAQTRLSVRSRIGTELARLVDEDVPEAMVRGEIQYRIESIAYQLQGRGIGLEDYLRLTGNDPETFTAQIREAAEEAVRVDLALRAIAAAEGLEATDEELDEEIARQIVGTDLDLDEARRQLQDGGQLSAVRSDVSKRKALEWLVEHSEVVDTDGNPVPEELLRLPEEDEHEHGHDHEGHDHDHDH